MNRNRFFLLIGVTVAVIVAVILLGRGGSSGAREQQALVPGLDAMVNEVDAIDIIAPGGEIAVSLRRDEQRWRVAGKDDYEAEFSQVVELLRALAEARLAEPRTDNPEWYARLGVQDPGEAEATGRRLDFPGRELSSIIIGQSDPTGEGSYVRRADAAQSWLADRVIEVPIDPIEWLEPGIMDISSADIATVTVTHADGQTLRIERAETAESDAAEFVLRDVPAGRQAGPAWKRTSLANGLRALNLEDVRRFTPPVPEDATQVVFTTTDGLQFTADLFEQDEKYWAHFNVAVDPNAAPPEPAAEDNPPEAASEADPSAEAQAANPQPAGTPSGRLADAAASGSDGPPDTSAEPDAAGESKPEARDPAAERLANAVAADARLSPWLFAIPKSRYDDLTRRLEDYLEPVEDASASDAASGG